jgi:Tol biopolymer transport system component
MDVWTRGVGLSLAVLAVTVPVSADVTRVSAAGGAQADAPVHDAAVSADGTVLAFVTAATTLAAGCGGGPGWGDVFVRERLAGALACVRATGGDPPSPALSRDGRYVAFRSGVGGGSTPPRVQTFVHDRQTGVTEMASVASDGAPATPTSARRDTSLPPVISADGRYVAFGSDAANLVPGAVGLHVYVRDRVTGQTSWVSRAPGGAPLAASPVGGGPALSADGRIVAWATRPPAEIYVHDRATGTTERVGPGHFPALSADGRFLAFVSDAGDVVPGDTNGAPDVFVRDRASGATQRVSVASDGAQADGSSCPANGPPCRVAISGDGRVVAFASAATNLVPGDTNGAADVFRHDRGTGQTRLVSRPPGGGVSDGPSGGPGLAGDGSAVVFVSDAANLVGDDTNGTSDAFVAVLADGPPGPAASRPGWLVTVPGPGGGPHLRVFGRGPQAVSGLVAGAGVASGLFVAVGNVDGAGEPEIVIGADAGGGPDVRVLRADGSDTGLGFVAYDPGLAGGVRVAACDVDGDGRAEIVTAPGPGAGPHVRVWRVGEGSVREAAGFFAYAPEFTAGLFVACGDLDGDGRAAIVTGADASGGPHVRVWRVDGGRVTDAGGFFAYDAAFAGGVRVAVADLDGDGRAEVVTAPGPGGGPHVRVWRMAAGQAVEGGGLLAYAPAFRGGLFVAAGDLDGDGRAELAVAPGGGGAPHVRVFSAELVEVLGFFAYDPAFTGGVRLAVGR